MNLETTLKVVLIGNSNVGKTSIIRQYMEKRFFDQLMTTIHPDFTTKQIFFNDKPAQLQLWDTAGQERFRSLGISFYRDAHCCVLVYDVKDADSINALSFWKTEFLTYRSPQNSDFPFVVLGNKVDLISSQQKELQETVRTLFHRKDNVSCFEISAKEALNIEEAFEVIIKNAYTQAEIREEEEDFGDPVTLRLIDNRRKKCAC